MSSSRAATKKFGADVRDEFVVEFSCKLQLTRNITLLPDLQLLIDPATNPDKDGVWVVGLRGILTL